MVIGNEAIPTQIPRIEYKGYEPHDVPLVPTREQIEEAEELIEQLHPEIRKRLPDLLGVYIVFSSS